MADDKNRERERISETSNMLKRSYKDSEQRDKEDDFSNSQSVSDCSNLSSSPKKLKVYSYRDQNNESLDSDSLRNTVDSPSFSNSLDSGTWLTSWSKSTSASGLELSAVIQRCDVSTLNSFGMSSMCENAVSSPFPQTQEMESQSQPKVPSLNSISMKEMLNFSKTTSTESVDMVSISSQPSDLKNREVSNNFITNNIVTETQNVSSLITIVRNDHMNQVACEMSVKQESCKSHTKIEDHAKDASITPQEVTELMHLKSNKSHSNGSLKVVKSKRMQEGKKNDDCNPIVSPSHEIFSLLEKYNSCDKKLGHNRFYSPKDLKVTHLPPEIQHEDSVTFFQCLSKLVVQITVSHTSEKRGKNDVYSSYIGTNKDRYGSGFIASSDKNIMTLRCTKKDCPVYGEIEKYSSHDVLVREHDRGFSNYASSRVKKHSIYGGVVVRTNRHVIFDKSEADNACVTFFFHSLNCKEIVKGHVSSILGINNEQDHVILHVMSHNKLLNDTVCTHMKNAKSSYKQMIKSTHSIQQSRDSNKLTWVAVMSYPHGIPISISFGHLRNEEAETKRVIKYYDASTCPGSSGGLVVTPTLLHLQWPGAVHSSFCQKSRFNVSLDSRSPELEPSVINEMNKNILNSTDSAPECHFKI